MDACGRVSFTSRGCYRCEASGREAVVFHRERAATKQMGQDRLARRVKDADIWKKYTVSF